MESYTTGNREYAWSSSDGQGGTFGFALRGFRRMKEDGAVVRVQPIRAKCVKPSMVQYADGREAHQQASVISAHVVQVYDSIQDDEHYTFFQEECDYATMDVIQSGLPINEQLSFMVQVLSDVTAGLQALAEQTPPIIHSDISFGNILVKRNVEAKGSKYATSLMKLCDFGESSTFVDGSVVSYPRGTNVSPDMVYGKVDLQTDVFSLAVVFIDGCQERYERGRQGAQPVTALHQLIRKHAVRFLNTMGTGNPEFEASRDDLLRVLKTDVPSYLATAIARFQQSNTEPLLADVLDVTLQGMIVMDKRLRWPIQIIHPIIQALRFVLLPATPNKIKLELNELLTVFASSIKALPLVSDEFTESGYGTAQLEEATRHADIITKVMAPWFSQSESAATHRWTECTLTFLGLGTFDVTIYPAVVDEPITVKRMFACFLEQYPEVATQELITKHVFAPSTILLRLPFQSAQKPKTQEDDQAEGTVLGDFAPLSLESPCPSSVVVFSSAENLPVQPVVAKALGDLLLVLSRAARPDDIVQMVEEKVEQLNTFKRALTAQIAFQQRLQTLTQSPMFDSLVRVLLTVNADLVKTARSDLQDDSPDYHELNGWLDGLFYFAESLRRSVNSSPQTTQQNLHKPIKVALLRQQTEAVQECLRLLRSDPKRPDFSMIVEDINASLALVRRQAHAFWSQGAWTSILCQVTETTTASTFHTLKLVYHIMTKPASIEAKLVGLGREPSYPVGSTQAKIQDVWQTLLRLDAQLTAVLQQPLMSDPNITTRIAQLTHRVTVNDRRIVELQAYIKRKQLTRPTIRSTVTTVTEDEVIQQVEAELSANAAPDVGAASSAPAPAPESQPLQAGEPALVDQQVAEVAETEQELKSEPEPETETETETETEMEVAQTPSVDSMPSENATTQSSLSSQVPLFSLAPSTLVAPSLPATVPCVPDELTEDMFTIDVPMPPLTAWVALLRPENSSVLSSIIRNPRCKDHILALYQLFPSMDATAVLDVEVETEAEGRHSGACMSRLKRTLARIESLLCELPSGPHPDIAWLKTEIARLRKIYFELPEPSEDDEPSTLPQQDKLDLLRTWVIARELQRAVTSQDAEIRRLQAEVFGTFNAAN
eukprot:m.7279 g.7279  ORF g.7279 m.7279 type:complete len:1115 (-) comp5232_c1_seq1:75-3419(-)